MARIVEKLHDQRLKKFGINIKTKYKNDNFILERNSDNSKNDDIKKSIILEKDYYKNGILMKKLFNFDPRIEYTFISSQNENSMNTCPNCGYTDKVSNFLNGCPYCGTNYNIDYTDKDLGSKYHYDMAVNSNNYIKITLLVDIVISLIIFFLYIKSTSRTFNIYDIVKFILGGLLMGSALFYVFYLLDALILLIPIKNYKEKLNKLQTEFWVSMSKKNIDKLKFYNNLNFELQNYYYGNIEKNQNVIDYDIVDYNNFKYYLENNKTYIQVNVNIRVVRIIKNKIISKMEKETFTLEKNEGIVQKLNNGINVINCHNCGASIDVLDNCCSYCKTVNNYTQEWYLKF